MEHKRKDLMLSQTHKAKPTPLQNLVAMLVHSFSVCTISVLHLGTSKPSFLLVLEAATCPHYMLRLSYDLDELQEAQWGENSGLSYSTVPTIVLLFPRMQREGCLSMFTSWRWIMWPEHLPEKTAAAEAL